MAAQRVGEEVRSVYIGRGRYNFISNHFFARNNAYHIYCRPEEVTTEIEKIFGMLRVCSRFVSGHLLTIFSLTELPQEHPTDT
jgi:hypothetical protein